MMYFCDIFGNGQSQSIAAVRLPGLVSPVESVEDSREIAVLRIREIVHDGQTNLAVYSMQFHMDCTRFFTILGSIIDQNRDQFPDRGFISL